MAYFLRDGPRIRKPTPKTDVLGLWRITAAQRNFALNDMVKFTRIRNGASSVEIRRAGQALDPLPHVDPPSATGGRPSQTCGLRRLGSGQNTTDQRNATKRSLNILQWNAEEIYSKKLLLTARLHSEDIDIACIQETHLTDKMRFNIRGYEPYKPSHRTPTTLSCGFAPTETNSRRQYMNL